MVSLVGTLQFGDVPVAGSVSCGSLPPSIEMKAQQLRVYNMFKFPAWEKLNLIPPSFDKTAQPRLEMGGFCDPVPN